jgi:hypothetical protein
MAMHKFCDTRSIPYKTHTDLRRDPPRDFVRFCLLIWRGRYVHDSIWWRALTLLVSRRRSKIAMWVSIALFSVSFAFLV